MRRAFSLVELSIVLVILGLLVGGVLSGQSLIRASELRAVATEYQRYLTATTTFRDKYFSLPGDMANATSFWGADAPANCVWNSTAGSTSGGVTCNGDGNGQIAADPAYATNEPYRAWQQLGAAALIEGSYTGVCNPCNFGGAGGSVVGVNVPKSKLSSAGWMMDSFGTIPVSNTELFDSNYGNALLIGAVSTAGYYAGYTMAPIFKPEEAWNIDSKLDDGKPATGIVMSYESSSGAGSTTCSDLAGSTTLSLTAAVYRLDNSGKNCALIMKMKI